MTAQREANHPLFYRVGSRRLRRTLLGALYGGWLLIAAIVLLWTLNFQAWFPAMELFMLAAVVCELVFFVWLGRTYVNAPRLADVELDERLLQVKNQAYRRAYLVLAPLATVAWLLSLAALQWQPNDQGRIIATALLLGVAMLAGTLPTAIVAWQEPDPEPLRQLGRLARSDREPSLVPALGTLVQADHGVGLRRVRVHGPELHRHRRLVAITGRGVLVSHGLRLRAAS